MEFIPPFLIGTKYLFTPSILMLYAKYNDGKIMPKFFPFTQKKGFPPPSFSLGGVGFFYVITLKPYRDMASYITNFLTVYSIQLCYTCLLVRY